MRFFLKKIQGQEKGFGSPISFETIIQGKVPVDSMPHFLKVPFFKHFRVQNELKKAAPPKLVDWRASLSTRNRNSL
jgi:hypothetical protein